MLCGSCVNYESHKKKGILPTNLSCAHWHVELDSLSLNLKRSIILISQLRYFKPDIFSMFYSYWEGAPVTSIFTKKYHYKRRCRDCEHFSSCGVEKDTTAYEHDCDEWSYDISRKRNIIQCPSMLRRILNLTDRLGRNDSKYIDLFLARYANLTPLTYLGARVSITLYGKSCKGKVVDITEEHIVILVDNRIRVAILHNSWNSLLCNKSLRI